MMGGVGLKVLEFIERNHPIDHVEETGPYLLTKLNSLRSHEIVGDVRGKGFFTGVEFVQDRISKKPFGFKEFAKVSNMVIDKSFENGLMVYPGGSTVDGFKGDHILVVPLLTTQKNEIEEIVRLLEQSITEVEQDLKAK